MGEEERQMIPQQQLFGERIPQKVLPSLIRNLLSFRKDNVYILDSCSCF